MSDADTNESEVDDPEADQEAAAPDVPMAHGAPVTTSAGQTVLHAGPDELLELAANLAAEGFHLLDVMGVDYLTYGADRAVPPTTTPTRFEVVYLLINHQSRERLRLRVQAGDDSPEVPSVFDVWPGAEAPERETYDMFGVTFTDHPDLSRILMPEDWQGHPLRKDYDMGRIPVQFKDAPARR